MTEVIIATEGDIPRILEIEHEAFSPPWTHGALLAEIYNEDSFFALAVLQGEVVGFCILRRMADEGELLQIAVDPMYRRRGLADKLVIAALDWAKAQGLHSVFLEVRVSATPAAALYEKHGFESMGQRKDYYTDPTEDAVLMRKGLVARG